MHVNLTYPLLSTTATFKNGLCYEYVPGSTLNPQSVYEPKIWRLVATNMALMHKLPLSDEQLKSDAMFKTKTLRFLNLIPEKFTNQAIHERYNLHFHFTQSLRVFAFSYSGSRQYFRQYRCFVTSFISYMLSLKNWNHQYFFVITTCCLEMWFTLKKAIK